MLGKHTLKPKEKTYLKITFDTTGSPGPFRKTVTISTGNLDQKEITVTIEGTVKEAPAAKIQVTPRRVDFGTIKRGSVKRQQFTVTNTGTLPLFIKRVYVKGSGTPFFEGSREGDMVIEPGRTKRIELAIRTDKDGGRFQELILIESNAKNATKGGYVIVVQYDSS